MSKKRLLWVADSETDPFVYSRYPAPFVWGAYGESPGGDMVYLEFGSTDDFVDYISGIRCVVYAHNGGKFDWHFLLNHLGEFAELTIIDGRVSKFSIGEAEFRDSYNILPTRLANIGPKQADFDYTILEEEVRDNPANKRKISNYLRQDCVALYQAVADFESLYGRPLTLAGAAFKFWHSLSGLSVPEIPRSEADHARPYYIGGRVESFFMGEYRGNFDVIDLNSAYPYAMCSYHPYGSILSVSDKLPKTRAYIQRSLIKLACVSRGALPWRDPDNKGALTYPNDDQVRVYHITGWEYLAGLDTETISNITILECTQYSDTINFKAYVEHFTRQKTAAKELGDDAGYVRAKLMQNSLYGKYATDPTKHRDYEALHPSHIMAAEADGWGFCGVLSRGLCVMSRPTDESKHRYYSVATAASITGYVRAMLWRAICSVGPHNVLYCDTDSLMTTTTADLTLHPTKLGSWDLEARCDYGAFAGKKLYAVRKLDGTYKTAHKGCVLTPRQIITVAQGGSVVYRSATPTLSVSGWSFVTRVIGGDNGDNVDIGDNG